MFEKMFKGMFVLTVWGFILIAVAALLPDSAWENFPEKLLPVRDFLAEKNIISSQFRPENRGNSDVAKKNQGTQPLPATPRTDLPTPKAPQDMPRQSFTGVSQTALSTHATQTANSDDSKLVIPPFPTGTGAAALDKDRVSLAESLPKQPETQRLNDVPAKSSELGQGTNIPGSPVANLPKVDAVASNPENGSKKNANDTLPELSFDSTSPLASSTPASPAQNLSIDTAILSTPGAGTTKTPAAGLPSPVAGTAQLSEPEKPIGTATLPDTGVISTTSATNANGAPFPSVGNLNLNNPSTTAPVPASPVLANPAPAPQAISTSPAAVAPVQSPTQTPAQPLVNPSQELVQALVLSRNP
ncbi:MAG: hypothetical protein Q4G59_01220, partial [Planctomycetia bacterium]|nr:hypothetical protein [Planctomycetia bacterium]